MEEYATIGDFLEHVSLVMDNDENRQGEKVTIMTIHAAKGLEFPAVFVIGMEDGVFPHLRSIGEPDEMEEERRLAYVALTRARERLYLTHAWSRTLYGGTQYNPPSRFLDEIPSELVEEIGGRQRASRGGRTYSGGGSERAGRRAGGWSEPEGRTFGRGDRKERMDAGRDRIVENALALSPDDDEVVIRVELGDKDRAFEWLEKVVEKREGDGYLNVDPALDPVRGDPRFREMLKKAGFPY